MNDLDLDARIATLSAELADLLRQKFTQRPVLNSWTLLNDYLRAKLVPLDREEVRILYLNTRNHLIGDEMHARGTVDQCPLFIREVIRRALELNATALILAHNHPSGDPTPSREDIKFTRNLIEAVRPLDIIIHDHVIVAGAADPLSMRAQGLL